MIAKMSLKLQHISFIILNIVYLCFSFLSNLVRELFYGFFFFMDLFNELSF